MNEEQSLNHKPFSESRQADGTNGDDDDDDVVPNDDGDDNDDDDDDDDVNNRNDRQDCKGFKCLLCRKMFMINN
ncbi:hypothetical protein ElyMa_006009800 [Elysia marginata]|uniref:Uncharacterized protein n=1 Tax=Elysia marginata TaxID=1093978 RepID=A0AAV4GHG4_9GAST|nr:hypothetical protein ElyMa_006009800 [Elysia marginata]